MFFFKKLLSKSKPLDYNDEAVDNLLILIIYKNADEAGKVKIKQLDFLWEKATGKSWEFKKSFSKYIKSSEAYKFHKGPRAGTHEVSLSQDIITMSKVNHLIKEEQNKYRNLLFTFIKKGNLKVVKSLIEEKNIDENLSDKNGDKPIHYAVRYERLGILQYLCEKREIDPNEKNKFGETPIFFAVKNKDIFCLQYLIEDRKVSINVVDQLGIKPLFFPVKSGKLEHIKILLNEENCNAFLCGEDYTALQLAAQWNQIEVIKWLCETFPALRVDKKNKEGKTAFDFAKNEKIREYLSEKLKEKESGEQEGEEEEENNENIEKKENLELSSSSSSEEEKEEKEELEKNTSKKEEKNIEDEEDEEEENIFQIKEESTQESKKKVLFLKEEIDMD